MGELRIILLCGNRFALPVLKELAFAKLLAVVAIPRPCVEMIEQVEIGLAGSGIPILIVDKKKFADQLQKGIAYHQVNMGLVATFSYKIPAAVYELTPKGFYNIHPGPLPGYRGADPVFQQIKNQEKMAAVSIHSLSEEFDRGPIVMLEKIKLNPTDSFGLLTTKLAQLAAALCRVLIKLASFDLPIPSRVQDESIAAYYKKQGAKDITIDWQQMNARAIIALMNACNPWNKGAVTKINNQIIRLVEGISLTSDLSLNPGKEPGIILAMGTDGMTISTIEGESIHITIAYAEEGFMSAGKLSQIGIVAGNRFENI